MEHAQTELMAYLELAGVIEFRYDTAEDVLEIFKISQKGSKSLYRGSLALWSETCLNGERKEEKKGKVLELCDRLRAGKGQAGLRLDIGKRCYEIRCLAENGGRVIYGTARALKNGSQSLEHGYRRALDKDAMLDMLNKRAITEYAKRTMENPKCPTTYMVIFDLDNFKAVNDGYGHLAGDEVLVNVTEIIKQSVGKRGVIGRIGGDEIMIVTKGISSKEELRPILSAIRLNVERAYKGVFGAVSLTCSMGAAAYPDHGSSYTEVMKIADKMLYLAKDKGRNRYIIFTPEMHREYVRELSPAVKEEVADSPVQYDRNRIMLYMLENYLVLGSSSNEFAFTQVGNAYHLSEILAVFGNGSKGFQWTPEGFSLDDGSFMQIEADDEFFTGFNEDGVFVMDALYAVSERYPEMERKLVERDVQSAIFYQIKHKGKPDGYIMFAKKGQRQKWSEYEILALSSIGKMFELYVYGNER